MSNSGQSAVAVLLVLFVASAGLRNQAMGLCLSCFKGSVADSASPVDVAAKRQQMAEAAERRIQQQESRGIKDPLKFKRLQQKRDELDRDLEAAGTQDGNLRWQVQ